METVPRGDDVEGDHIHSAAAHRCQRVAYASGQMVHMIDHSAARDNTWAVVVPELHCA